MFLDYYKFRKVMNLLTDGQELMLVMTAGLIYEGVKAYKKASFEAVTVSENVKTIPEISKYAELVTKSPKLIPVVFALLIILAWIIYLTGCSIKNKEKERLKKEYEEEIHKRAREVRKPSFEGIDLSNASLKDMMKSLNDTLDKAYDKTRSFTTK